MAWTLAQYRSELRGALSIDVGDELWTDAALDGYINRAIRRIWFSLTRVAQDEFAQVDSSFAIAPDASGYVTADLPAGAFAVLDFEVGGVQFPQLDRRTGEKTTATGWWVDGGKLKASGVDPSATTATLRYLAWPSTLVNDTDTDTLPDEVIRGFVVPLAAVYANIREQSLAEHAKFRSALEGEIDAYIRSTYPVNQNYDTVVRIDLEHLSGFGA